MRIRIALTLAFLLLAAATVLGQAPLVNEKAGVVGTVHDLSGTSGETCANCHSVHAARADADLLWARALSEREFTTYDSAGLTVSGGNSFDGTPAGAGITSEEWASFLCMSCHDDAGVPNDTGIPVGGNRQGAAATATFSGVTTTDIASTTIYPVRNTALPTTVPIGVAGVTTFTTTQLEADHPVNIEYNNYTGQVPGPGNALLETEANAITNGVKFYDNSAGTPTVQCGSCHNPHELNYVRADRTGGTGPGTTSWENRSYFIRGRLTRGEDLCLACHL